MRRVTDLLRVWRQAPGAAVLAVASLAVGWAAATIAVSASVAFHYGPLPWANERSVVALFAHSTDENAGRFGHQPWDRTRYERLEEVLRSVPAKFPIVYRTYGGGLLHGDGVDGYLSADVVSPAFFQVLGGVAQRGRTFTTQDSIAGDDRLIVLSDRLWRARFGARESVINSRVWLDSIPYTVIGVMPRRFDRWGERDDNAWIPIDARWTRGEGRRFGAQAFIGGVPAENLPELRVAVARGVADLKRRLGRALPGFYAIEPVPLRRYVLSESIAFVLLPFLIAVAGAVVFVAGMNFTILVLLRGVARAREFAIRAALGAAPGRIVGRVVLEGQALVALALVLGVILAQWAIAGTRMFDGPMFPRWISPGIDWRVAVAMTAIAVVLGGMFALPPAWSLRRADVQGALRTGSLSSSSGRRARRTIESLVFGEIAFVAIVLPVALWTGLQAWESGRLDVGFNYRDLVRSQVVGAPGRDGHRSPLPDDLERRLVAVPGVVSASTGQITPRGFSITTVAAPGERQRYLNAGSLGRSAGSLLRTLQVPVLDGRLPTAAEGEAQDAIVLLSSSAAERLFGSGRAVGRRLRVDLGETASHEYEVIGVVPDVRQDLLMNRDYQPEVFVTDARVDTVFGRYVYLRVTHETAGELDSLRARLARALPAVSFAELRTSEAVLQSGLQMFRGIFAFFLFLSAVFAVLAVAGVFGAVAYGVRLRLREIGIRRALGASGRGIVYLVTGSLAARAVAAALLALPVGLVFAAQLSNQRLGALFGADPAFTATTVAVFVGVVTCGALGPVLRGLRIAPMEVLREE